MDWKMPGMDGIETARRIKQHPTLKHIPAIIMATAYGREDVMRKAEQLGLDGFLLKPVSPSVLFDTIMQAFGKEISETSRAARIKEREAETSAKYPGRPDIAGGRQRDQPAGGQRNSGRCGPERHRGEQRPGGG